MAEEQFTPLKKRYFAFCEIFQFHENKIRNINAMREKAQKLLIDIRSTGKSILDFELRRIFSTYAIDLAEKIFKLSGDFPIARLESYQNQCLPRQQWLTDKKFIIDPFEYLDGASDPNLSYYFFKDSKFFNYYGSSEKLGAKFVFGKEGGGKSSLRNAISQLCIDDNTLAIEDSFFKFGQTDNAKEIPMSEYVNAILANALSMLSEQIETYRTPATPSVFMCELTQAERNFLWQYVEQYETEEIRKDFLNAALFPNNTEKMILPEDPVERFGRFCKTVTKLFQYNAIYFLIDPVREIEWDVLRPLLENRRLLELSEYRDYKVAFKFFLHQKFYDNALQISWIAERKEQIAYVLEWTETQFREMLKARLKLSSNGMVSSLAELLDGVEDADKIVLNAANGSPRKLIAICNRLFDLHCANLDDDKSLIKQETFDRAIALDIPVLPVEQEKEFAKTITSFMNADGGVLTLDTGFDVQKITAAYVVTEHPVCNCIHSEGENMRLRIEKSPTPVYYKNLENGEHEFYIRKEQSTERLDVKRAVEYIRAHFHAE